MADAEGSELAAEKAAAEVPSGVPGDVAPDTPAAVAEHLDTAGTVEPTPAQPVAPAAKGTSKATAAAPAKAPRRA